ncbi:MAG: hemoglobin [Planctomycetota bacterium]|jgi:hemoglobin
MAPAPRIRPIFIPPGGPPQGPRPPQAIFDQIGKKGVFDLTTSLYRELGESDIREMFPPNLDAASRKSGAFFIQLMGGPPLYSETYGPPRMRQRHIPFEIDQKARATWLACFDRALDEAIREDRFPESERAAFQAFLESFSTWMLNAE